MTPVVTISAVSGHSIRTGDTPHPPSASTREDSVRLLGRNAIASSADFGGIASASPTIDIGLADQQGYAAYRLVLPHGVKNGRAKADGDPGDRKDEAAGAATRSRFRGRGVGRLGRAGGDRLPVTVIGEGRVGARRVGRHRRAAGGLLARLDRAPAEDAGAHPSTVAERRGRTTRHAFHLVPRPHVSGPTAGAPGEENAGGRPSGSLAPPNHRQLQFVADLLTNRDERSHEVLDLQGNGTVQRVRQTKGTVGGRDHGMACVACRRRGSRLARRTSRQGR